MSASFSSRMGMFAFCLCVTFDQNRSSRYLFLLLSVWLISFWMKEQDMQSWSTEYSTQVGIFQYLRQLRRLRKRKRCQDGLYSKETSVDKGSLLMRVSQSWKKSVRMISAFLLREQLRQLRRLQHLSCRFCVNLKCRLTLIMKHPFPEGKGSNLNVRMLCWRLYSSAYLSLRSINVLNCSVKSSVISGLMNQMQKLEAASPISSNRVLISMHFSARKVEYSLLSLSQQQKYSSLKWFIVLRFLTSLGQFVRFGLISNRYARLRSEQLVTLSREQLFRKRVVHSIPSRNSRKVSCLKDSTNLMNSSKSPLSPSSMNWQYPLSISPRMLAK